MSARSTSAGWMRRRTTRRRFVTMAGALGVASVTAGLLSACREMPWTASSPTTSGSASVPPGTASGGRKTVLLWHSLGGGIGEALKTRIQTFNQGQQAITVEPEFKGKDYHELHQNVVIAKAGHAPLPDLVLTATAAQMAKQELLQPLDALAKKAAVDLDDFVPGMLSDCQYEKQFVALPAVRSTPVCFYNAAMFAEVGVDPNTYFASWKNVATEGVKFVKTVQGAYVRQAHGLPPAIWFWQQMILAFDGDLGDADGTVTFNRGPAVEALQFWQDLIYKHGVVRRNEVIDGFRAWDENSELLFGLNLAVSSQSSAQLKAMVVKAEAVRDHFKTQGYNDENNPFKLGVAPMPGMRTRAVPYGGANLAILKSSERQDEAMQFIAWFTSPPETLTWHVDTGYLPVRSSALKLQVDEPSKRPDPRHAVAIEQIAVARPTPLFALSTDFDSNVARPLLGKVLIGQQDVRESLDVAVKAMTGPNSASDKPAGG